MQTETEHLAGRPFTAARNRNITRYPNLVELYKHHPYREPAMCDHGGIEPELLQAVLYDGERLEPSELLGLARLYGCPVVVLEHRELIMLDRNKPKHRKMIAEVDNLYIKLKCMAREGNEQAKTYAELTDWTQQGFLRAAHINKLSYCHYLGMREKIRMYISFSTPRPRRRGLSSGKGGAA